MFYFFPSIPLKRGPIPPEHILRFKSACSVKPYVNTFQANNSIIPFQGCDALVCFVSFHCCTCKCMTDEAVENVVSCYQEVD